jgi:hypothetical protein
MRNRSLPGNILAVIFAALYLILTGYLIWEVSDAAARMFSSAAYNMKGDMNVLKFVDISSSDLQCIDDSGVDMGRD